VFTGSPPLVPVCISELHKTRIIIQLHGQSLRTYNLIVSAKQANNASKQRETFEPLSGQNCRYPKNSALE